MVVIAAFSMPGSIITGLALKQLRLGIENQRWPSAQIDTLRGDMNSRYWRVAYIACGLAFLGCQFAKEQFHLLGWGAYFSCSGLYYLQNQLRYPNDVPGASLAITPDRPTPLTSSHWGHPLTPLLSPPIK